MLEQILVCLGMFFFVVSVLALAAVLVIQLFVFIMKFGR